jgi:hypothetical protein
VTGFYVNQLFRLATAKIFCSPPGCMLVESSEDIDSDTGIVVGMIDTNYSLVISFNLLAASIPAASGEMILRRT